MSNVIPFPARDVPIPHEWEPKDVALLNVDTEEILDTQALHDRVYYEAARPIDWDKWVGLFTTAVSFAVVAKILMS